LASRIYVLRSGRIAAEVETTSTTEEQVLKLMAG
jgi:ABC-type sugar transport system ATPase subunit